MRLAKGAVKTEQLSPSSLPLTLVSQGQCIYISSIECMDHREKTMAASEVALGGSLELHRPATEVSQLAHPPPHPTPKPALNHT